MNISKEVLELDFDKIYNNLELESQRGYDKYIKYMQLPKCITSFVMYCYDIIYSVCEEEILNPYIEISSNDRIKIKGSWTLFYLKQNYIIISNQSLVKFNNQIPE